MAAMLVLFGDLEKRGERIGWRTWSRIIAGVGLAKRRGNVTIYTSATRSKGYPSMPCDGAKMQEEAIYSFAPEVPVVALCGDGEWSSRGELRKFFAALSLGEKIIFVSGKYHLNRLRGLVEEYHPEFAPFVEYYEVDYDRLTLMGQCVEMAKCVLTHFPEGTQSFVRRCLEGARAVRERFRVAVLG